MAFFLTTFLMSLILCLRSRTYVSTCFAIRKFEFLQACGFIWIQLTTEECIVNLICIVALRGFHCLFFSNSRSWTRWFSCYIFNINQYNIGQGHLDRTNHDAIYNRAVCDTCSLSRSHWISIVLVVKVYDSSIIDSVELPVVMKCPCFLAFDYCRFCVVIRFFYPRHNGQWPPTSKDFLSQILSISFIYLS